MAAVHFSPIAEPITFQGDQQESTGAATTEDFDFVGVLEELSPRQPILQRFFGVRFFFRFHFGSRRLGNHLIPILGTPCIHTVHPNESEMRLRDQSDERLD